MSRQRSRPSVRTLWTRRDRIVDVVLFACLAGTVLLTATLFPADGPAGGPTDGPADGPGAGSLPALAGHLALLAAVIVVGRFRPTLALLAAALLSVATVWLAAALVTFAYLHGRRVAASRPAVVVLGVTVVSGILAVAIRGATANSWITTAVVVIFAGVVPWLTGRYRRQRHDLIHAGWVRAEMLERQQQVLADQIRLRERARIAEEMHDSLGHEISLIALRAAALQVAPDLDERHRREANQLRENAAAATRRLRDIIGVLRDPQEPAPVRPSHESIADLVDRARSAGMTVRLEHVGGPGPVPERVDRAAGHVVREALTNATKHAPGAAVEVTLAHSDTTTTVRVRNGPPADVPAPDRPRGRLGLAAIRERVHLAGGTLTAEAVDDGFLLTARLPHDPPATGLPHGADRSVPGPDREAALDLDRRRLRRSLAAAVVLPVVAVVMMMIGNYVYVTYDAVLDTADFDRLTVGARQSDVERALPSRQVPGRPAYEPAVPAGSACRYYSDGSFLVGNHAYRLCFRNGLLVAKDELTDHR